MRNRRRVLSALLVPTAAVLAVASAAPASAAQRPAVKATSAGSTNAQYPPLVGNAPTSGVHDLDPETCARPEATFCDTVPVDVVSAGDVTIEVGWADLDGGTDDIDFILYDNGRNGEYSRLDASETGNRPEQVTKNLPVGRVNVVVVHYAGVNNGYELTTWVRDPSTPAMAAAKPSTTATPAPAAPGASPAVKRPSARPSAPSSFAARAPRVAPLGSAPALDAAVPSVTDAPTLPAASRTSAQAAPAVLGDPGGDLGWAGWVVAGIFPLALAAVVLTNRRAQNSAAL